MALPARQLSVLVLLLGAGCASMSPPSTFTRLLRPAPKPAVDETGEATHVQDDEKAREEKDEYPLVAAKGSGERPGRHEPSTRMLIEAELKDASPEERQEWLAFLNGIEDEQVPYVLRARRMAQGREQGRIASAEPAVPATDASPVRTASAMSTVDDESILNGVGGGTQIRNATAEAVAPQETTSAAGSNWQKKIKSFADPNWLWSHPVTESENDVAVASLEKTERSSFGLSPLRNTHSRNETAHTQTGPPSPAVVAAQTPASSVPAQEAAETHLTPGSALWQDETQKLISLLEAETSSPSVDGKSGVDRATLRQQIGLRMLYLVVNEPQKAQQAIPGLPAAEQEFWTTLFLALAEDLDEKNVTDPAERATHTVAQLRSAAWQLQQSAHLRLRNVTFCRQIDGFGNYELLPADELVPGQAVLIYAEIRNFASVPTANGYYSTRIKSTTEIYTAGTERQLLDRSSFDVTEDHCRVIRSDYYHSYRLNIPSYLSSGSHILKLTIQDEQTGKTATETIPFTIR